MARPVVAIVGRPNVGKSTFFNRLIGARHAIVDDRPGVTRDRIYRETDWAGHDFLLIDTGGIITNTNEEIAGQVFDQVKIAMDEADVIVFMVDGKQGLVGPDRDVANLLRRSKKPIILAVNKVDEPKEEANISEFFELGLGTPLGLSAMRGTGGVGDLLDTIVASFPDEAQQAAREKKLAAQLGENGYDEGEGKDDEPQGPISIAIVGRPNVGKSSMANVLSGTNRSIVAAAPGTTRDAIDTTIKYKGKPFTIVDTAGIRRKSKVEYGVEAFSVVRAIQSIGRSDVVVLMLDSTQEIADQDQKIAAKIEEAGKPAVVVMNKWDLIEEKSSGAMNKFTEEVHSQLRMISFAEVLFTSALTKQRANKILEAAERACAESRRRISTGLLNQVVNEAVALVPPPAAKRGKRLRVYYTTQVAVAPPTFVLFVNDDKLLAQNYYTYLERKLREAFGFKGTPLKLITRAKKETR